MRKNKLNASNGIPNQWWYEVNQEGLFVSEPVLNQTIPDGPQLITNELYTQLKESYTLFLGTTYIENVQLTIKRQIDWVTTLLDRLRFPKNYSWNYASLSKIEKHQENIIATSIFYNANTNLRILTINDSMKNTTSLKKSTLVVYINKRNQKLGIGKSRNELVNFTRFLRNFDLRLGIFTNGDQFRLIYLGNDHDAWIEWNVKTWFDNSEYSKELISSFIEFISERNGKFDLHELVNQSRDKQAELSSVIGIQAREAIEIFLEGHSGDVETSQKLIKAVLGYEHIEGVLLPTKLEPIYQAVVRILMRFVIVLYSEARGLLPIQSVEYRDSYSMEQLYVTLEEASQELGEQLDEQFHAWPRVLALFQLIYYGSPFFEEIDIPAYGGSLFKPSDSKSSDPVEKALEIFESTDWKISDEEILSIMRKLKTTRIKIKSGKKFTTTTGNIDFSELRTEYIGMIYEGLLDFQLRYVTPGDEAVMIIRLGSDFAFSLNRLRNMSNKELGNLTKHLKKEGKSEALGGYQHLNLEEKELPQRDGRTVVKRMIIAGNLLGKKENMEKKIEQILIKTYPKGKLYLTTWKGTRKGSGTYYTRPRLVYPLVEKVMAPLLYYDKERKCIKKPADILKLNILDPAMGSGSFLVSTVRYFARMLLKSLEHYNLINYKLSSVEIHFTSSKDEFFNLEIPKSENLMKLETIILTRLKRYVIEDV